MIDKIINDVPLKKLTFQTRQTKWDGGSNIQKIQFTLLHTFGTMVTL